MLFFERKTKNHADAAAMRVTFVFFSSFFLCHEKIMQISCSGKKEVNLIFFQNFSTLKYCFSDFFLSLEKKLKKWEKCDKNFLRIEFQQLKF